MRTNLHGALPTLAFLVVLSAAGRSDAQEWRGVPTFATLDRGDGDSLIGVDIGAAFFKSERLVDQGFRFDFHGQAVNRRGLGLYAGVPLSRSTGDTEGTGLGALEIGGLWVTPQDPLYSFVLRLGVALPTASDSVDGFAANVAGVFSRMTDMALIIPDTTWIRLSASPVLRGELFFFRADLGLDLPILEGDSDPDPLLRANLGVGLDPGSVSFTAELATLGNTFFAGVDEDFTHTFALAARYIGGAIQPSLALGLPLDESGRDDVTLFLIAGVQAVL